MGHSLSANKRERQNIKRAKHNRENRTVLRKEIKRVTAEIASGKGDAKTTLSAGFKALDKAARKNAIPKKRADRKKSRLAKALNRAAKAAVKA
jgi:small subunit ribosomal protein S20